MVKLSDDENRIIDGEAGKLKQVAMQNIVRYAEILGAQSLCEVTKATVFCGAHHYLDACKSEDFDVVFSRMNMASDEVLTFDTTCNNCYIQSCVSPCDHHAYKPFKMIIKYWNFGRWFQFWSFGFYSMIHTDPSSRRAGRDHGVILIFLSAICGLCEK